MLAAVDDLQNATALIGQHADTRRWGIVLQFENGAVWLSEETFASHQEAQDALDAWVDEIGGSQQRLH